MTLNKSVVPATVVFLIDFFWRLKQTFPAWASDIQISPFPRNTPWRCTESFIIVTGNSFLKHLKNIAARFSAVRIEHRFPWVSFYWPLNFTSEPNIFPLSSNLITFHNKSRICKQSKNNCVRWACRCPLYFIPLVTFFDDPIVQKFTALGRRLTAGSVHWKHTLKTDVSNPTVLESSCALCKRVLSSSITDGSEPIAFQGRQRPTKRVEIVTVERSYLTGVKKATPRVAHRITSVNVKILDQHLTITARCADKAAQAQ